MLPCSFSGMTTAIQLKKKLNLSADIFESTEDIGGTWHYNQYPQAASDVPSHLYSFSFELNPSKFTERCEARGT